MIFPRGYRPHLFLSECPRPLPERFEGRSGGTAVNEAARITATARGSEILVSDVVSQLVKEKGFLFADRGEANLEEFEEPVRLYEVRWREER